ncbi:MAG: ribosome silencing factor [Oscillospiraceae bacterium]|nr:ribosome silencing factor [Oscillospiraceae bacterium]
MLNPIDIAKLAVKALDDKKAQDIKLLKTTDVTVLADYFIICTAGSVTHVKTLSDELEVVLKKSGEAPLRREGGRTGDWILIDYACVVVHIFMQEAREFYTLERLWSDAEDVNIEDMIK